MARKKDPPKPLFGLKHDFVESLENVCHEAIMFLQAVDMVIKHSEIDQPVKDILIERSKGMRAALMSED